MKILAAALCGILILTIQASAAEPNVTGIGLHLRPKIGFNTASMPDGSTTFISFNGIPDFGATFYLPYPKKNNIAIVIEAGYLTNSYGETAAPSTISGVVFPEVDAVVKLNYIAVAPAFAIGVFNIGMELGLPVGGSINIPSFQASLGGQPLAPTKDTSINIDSGAMTLLVGLRMGLTIPITKNENGRLNFVAVASYALTGAQDNFDQATDKNGRSLSDDYNPKPASLSIGVSYLFSLNKE